MAMAELLSFCSVGNTTSCFHTYGEKEFWPDITSGHRAYEGWEVHLLIALNAERYPPLFCMGFMGGRGCHISGTLLG